MYSYDSFIDIATKNKVRYKKVVKEKKTNIQKKQVEEMVEILRESEFVLCEFRLDWQCTPCLAPKVADTTGVKYKRLSL